MASSYIMEINPELEKAQATKLEKDLGSRFQKIAKKYGDTLVRQTQRAGRALNNAMNKAGKLGAGLIGGVIGAIATDVTEGPLTELDQRLAKYDRIVGQAKQFGVGAGKYIQAQETFERLGVDNFDEMLTAYAVKLGEAQRGEDVSLKNFLGEKDVVEGMIKFIQSAGNVKDVGERTKMLAEVFGEDDVLKLSRVLTSDIRAVREKIFTGIDPDLMTTHLNKISEMADIQAYNRAQLAWNDLQQTSNSINEKALAIQRQKEIEQLNRIHSNIANLEELEKVSKGQQYVKTKGTNIMNKALAGDVGGVVGEVVGTGKDLVYAIGEGVKNYFKPSDKKNTDKILANQ